MYRKAKRKKTPLFGEFGTFTYKDAQKIPGWPYIGYGSSVPPEIQNIDTEPTDEDKRIAEELTYSLGREKSTNEQRYKVKMEHIQEKGFTPYVQSRVQQYHDERLKQEALELDTETFGQHKVQIVQDQVLGSLGIKLKSTSRKELLQPVDTESNIDLSRLQEDAKSGDIESIKNAVFKSNNFLLKYTARREPSEFVKGSYKF